MEKLVGIFFVIAAIVAVISIGMTCNMQTGGCADSARERGFPCMAGTERWDEDSCECTNQNGIGMIEWNPWW